ncbi:MAG: MFS transporter [Erythrobacteraceae bacterium]|jgi:benzoate transport
MTEQAGMSRLQYRVIALCIAINLLDGFDILAMAYTAPAIGAEWQLSPERLGILFSLGLAGMMAGSILLAPLADRFGRRPTILGSLAIAALSMLVASQSANLLQLGAARVATGLAIGAILPCINTMVAEYAAPKSRAFAVSLMQAGFAMGASAGGFLAVWLLAQFGWQSVFLAGAALTFILVPMVWFGMPESLAFLARQPARSEEHAALLARVGDVGEGGQVPADVHDNENRGWWRSHAAYRLPLTLISGAFFVSLMAFYFLTSWVPKLLVDGGLSQGQAVTAGALLTSGGIIAAFGLGWLSLKRSIIPIVASVTALSAAFTLLFGQLPSEVAWVLPAAFLLGLATNATQIGLYAIVPSLFPAQIRAGATGIAIGIGRTGSVVGPWLAGVLLSAGWSVAGLFAVMALPYLVGVFILLGLRDWQRH